MGTLPSRPMPRDLLGYGATPPDPRWPGGARVAVSFVLNVEEGAETSVAEGDSRNEAVYEVIDRLEGLPDPCLESHFDYGTRVGWWRIMKVFDDAVARCTVSACGRAVERTPSLAADAVRRGHEVSAHGWRWESHAGMAEADERAAIARTVAAIERATGVRPVGWHTRSASSPNTRRLLIEEGGFLYDSDWYGDDLPTTLRFGERRHVVLPYAFDTNDMQFQNTHRFVRAYDFSGYVLDAFDWLWREGAHAPRMMSVGLHLRMLGRPGRMQALVDMLVEMTRRPGVWIARRDEIARHWVSSGG
ncbi:MAG: polysaccharide deacetylase family protein [Burkholderiales bacterium]|nr:polysaccharide deacetylase family protein [Burkholderiales bacterium]